jgi:hypothetical protein
MSATTAPQKQISFIQSEVPPLRDGVYTLTATETVPGQTPGTFPATATFVVRGERFTIASNELISVFPPSLANGAFDGALPHVVFSRRTLPWERALRNGDASIADCTWLAVLLFDDAAAPTPTAVTAKDLVPAGTAITVTDSTATGTGTLPASILSYGAATLVPMGDGETPDDACIVIDIPVDTFSAIVPSVSDVRYLAHIRDVITHDGAQPDAQQQSAVVVGNRIPAPNVPCLAALVSLENMADYLPGDDGTPSPKLGNAIKHVRLLAYKTWTFTANDLGQNLVKLLENLNTAPAGSPSTLRLPISGDAPSATRVQQAAANQAAAAQGTGTLSADDATVIVQNALAMGYVPLDHHLRHGGHTVSWYRGPFAPFPVATTIAVPVGGPDAANRYDPQAGMFDVSYGAAWQVGQLLALQNSGVANAIYGWRQATRHARAAAAEQDRIRELLAGRRAFESLLATREGRLAPAGLVVPAQLAAWFDALAALQGVPFNYLVPDERMLPPESLRLFSVDGNWVDALMDGALSIGRATTGEAGDAEYVDAIRASVKSRRAEAAKAGGYAAPTGVVTGLLLRSQAVSGWPNLRFNGFGDGDATSPLRKLRFDNLAGDTLLCLFDGAIELLQIGQPPEQLHMGLEGDGKAYWTTLRAVDPPTPGAQLPPGKTKPPCNPDSTEAVACLDMRADGRTLRVSEGASTIQTILKTDFGQTLPNGFTSAEFALQLNQGVLTVEFKHATGAGAG